MEAKNESRIQTECPTYHKWDKDDNKPSFKINNNKVITLEEYTEKCNVLLENATKSRDETLQKLLKDIKYENYQNVICNYCDLLKTNRLKKEFINKEFSFKDWNDMVKVVRNMDSNTLWKYIIIANNLYKI